MALWRAVGLAVLLTVFFPSGRGVSASPPAAPRTPEHLIKLRFHLIKSDVSKRLQSTVGERKLRQWIDQVNIIWKPAAIRFELEHVLIRRARADAGFDERFIERSRDKREERQAIRRGERPLRESARLQWSEIMPEGERIDHGIDVFVVRRLPTGGGSFGCQLGAVLLADKGGGSRAGLMVGRVLAHELGHALRLGHVDCDRDRNLMGVGTGCQERTHTWIDLRPEQIEVARRVAATGRARKCRRDEPD